MKLKGKQLELASRYLAMSNMCTLDQFRKDIKDLPSLRNAVQNAWENAVTGIMEGQEGGYNDRYEGRAIKAVDEEINSFRKDLKAGGKRAEYWLKLLGEKVPYVFDEEE